MQLRSSSVSAPPPTNVFLSFALFVPCYFSPCALVRSCTRVCVCVLPELQSRGCGNFQENSDDDATGQSLAVGGFVQPGHSCLRKGGTYLLFSFVFGFLGDLVVHVVSAVSEVRSLFCERNFPEDKSPVDFNVPRTRFNSLGRCKECRGCYVK